MLFLVLAVEFLQPRQWRFEVERRHLLIRTHHLQRLFDAIAPHGEVVLGARFDCGDAHTHLGDIDDHVTRLHASTETQ